MRTPEAVRYAASNIDRTYNGEAVVILEEYAALLESKPKWKKVSEERPPEEGFVWIKTSYDSREVRQGRTFKHHPNSVSFIGNEGMFNLRDDDEWSLAIPPE